MRLYDFSRRNEWIDRMSARRPARGRRMRREHGADHGAGCGAGADDQQIIDQRKLNNRMGRIVHKVLVLSGKGGVGKSTVAVNLALSLMHKGKRVGLLDVDIHGPSVPKMLGLEGETILTEGETMLPVELGRPEGHVHWVPPAKPGGCAHLARTHENGGDQAVPHGRRLGRPGLPGDRRPPGDGRRAPLDLPAHRERGRGGRRDHAAGGGACSSAKIHHLLPQAESARARRGGKHERVRVPALRGALSRSSEPAVVSGMAQEMKVPFLGRIPIEPEVAASGDSGMPYIQNVPRHRDGQGLRGSHPADPGALALHGRRQAARASNLQARGNRRSAP